MDLPESTKVVYNRIQKLEPDYVSKIIGYLLLQDHGEHEMIRLAFSPDNLIYSLINKVKSDLGLNMLPASAPLSPSHSEVKPIPVSDVPLQFTTFSPASSRVASSPARHRASNPFWDGAVGDQHQLHKLDFAPPGYSESVAEDYHIQQQMCFSSLDDQLEFVNPEFPRSYFFSEHALGPRTNRRSPSLPEFPVKVCHYFIKGFCKHGNNCRYFHAHPMPGSFSQILSPDSNEIGIEEHVISPGSLEKLEFELIELLKSRRGVPISIAALPMIYYEKYGRSIQVEGYLSESQRHGKAGYSLTKLLARLKDRIRVIDRPHGQHSVILAEDAAKYLEYAGERNDHGGIVAGSRQIYLTFPAESTFSEHDVSNYFSKFGPVQDVRIPCQQKRMFGFVTFAFTETVNQILGKGNPHFVCGARVLVKPYREKPRVVDRKYMEKHATYYSQHFPESDSELHSMPRLCGNSRLLRKQLMEEHEQALELERMRLSELHFVPKQSVSNHHAYFDYQMDELRRSQGIGEQVEFPSTECLSHLMDVLHNGTTHERHISTNYIEQDSNGVNLPESPFASSRGSGISTAI